MVLTSDGAERNHDLVHLLRHGIAAFSHGGNLASGQDKDVAVARGGFEEAVEAVFVRLLVSSSDPRELA